MVVNNDLREQQNNQKVKKVTKNRAKRLFLTHLQLIKAKLSKAIKNCQMFEIS